MASFTDSKYGDMHERFVEETYRKNPKIKDFEDFVEALDDYLGAGFQGENAKRVMSPDDYKFLFQTRFNKDKIKENLDDDEYKEMFTRTDDHIRGDVEFEVIKKKKKDKVQISLFRTPKKVEVKGYTKDNKKIKSYIKGYSSWKDSETNYLKKLKEDKVPTSTAIKEYRQRFSGTNRSQSSIKTKYFRI